MRSSNANAEPQQARSLRVGVLASLLLLISACGVGDGEARIVSAVPNSALGTLDLKLALQLTDTQLQALDHGIALSFLFELVTPGKSRQTTRVALSYLPMARQYQLLVADQPGRLFSSRVQLLAALDQVRVPLPDIEARSGVVTLHLDTGALPAPLRLPALFNPEWRLQTEPFLWGVSQ